jgi:hypothetical protein
LLKVGGGIALSVIVAALLASLINARLHAPPEPVYSIDPRPLALTLTDVGSQFALLGDSGLGPTQRTAAPLPYQQLFVGGTLHFFMSKTVLSPQGTKEIADWERANTNFKPTDPPTILGSFVADHTGIFEINDAEQSYHTTASARQDFHCCHYARENNFDDYHTIPVQLGDEADAFTGYLIDAQNVADDYLQREYAIHWRHGPIVSSISILGAHDITFAQVLQLAQIVDQRIAHALKSPAKGDLDASPHPPCFFVWCVKCCRMCY